MLSSIDIGLYMFLLPTEMHVKLMQMLQKRSKWRALGHLGESVHVLGETLAAIAKLTVWTRHVGMCVVDIA